MRIHLISLLLCICLIFNSCTRSKQNQPQAPIIHSPKLSSGWHKKNKDDLNKEINHYFKLAQHYFPLNTNYSRINAFIVPHAGYTYSGLCAATTYQVLFEPTRNSIVQKNSSIKRVIVLAPNHTTFYNGIALPEYTIHQTALGDIQIDTTALKKLKRNYLFRPYQLAHDQEHAIEQQIPFLQTTIENFSLVPLIVGHLNWHEYTIAAKLLRQIIDDSTLVVVSSDFIHYGKDYDYTPFDHDIMAKIRLLDAQAVHHIASASLDQFTQLLEKTEATICGQEAIKILLALMTMDTFGKTQTDLICYYTSAHIKKTYSNQADIDIETFFQEIPDDQIKNCVSYVGLIFGTHKPEHSFTIYEQKILLSLARKTLENAFKQEDQQRSENLLCSFISPGLMRTHGAFVTLKTHDNQLRGCIGSIQTSEPLYKTVHNMTLAAAFNDTRFAPLTEPEINQISIEISILTQPTLIETPYDIELGRHGVILSKLDEQENVVASAVFLAHVPIEYKWDVTTTLEELSLKAGLDKDAWQNDCTFQVFEEIVFSEDTQKHQH